MLRRIVLVVVPLASLVAFAGFQFAKKEKSGGKITATARGAKSQGWFQYRGPNRDNVSADTGLLKSWPKSGPKLAWTARGLGQGYSSVVLAEGLVVTMGNQGDKETVIALKASDGEIAWTTENGPAYRDGTGDGPRGTPTIDGDAVYALGGRGQLICVELKTGKERWSKNILDEGKGSNITWGISESVLIDGDKLICTPGGSNGTLLALDKSTGKVLWRAKVPDAGQAGYSSPIVATVGNVRQYVQFTQNAVIGVRANDGEFLWADTSSANGTANCSTPMFFESYVFSASGYGQGGSLVQLTARGGKVASRRVYQTKEMKNHHGGMVYYKGFIYGSNDPGQLTCLEAKTGKVMWRDRSVGKGSITCADGHLYVRSEGGPIALVEATSAGYREKGRFDQPSRRGNSSWAHPVVADGKLFLRDMDVLLAYEVK